MKHRSAVLAAAVMIAAGVLVLPVTSGIIIDATGPAVANAQDVDPGGQSTACNNAYTDVGRVVYMMSTRFNAPVGSPYWHYWICDVNNGDHFFDYQRGAYFYRSDGSWGGGSPDLSGWATSWRWYAW